MQNDVGLIHEIEAVIGKQLEEFKCKENEVLSDSTRVRSSRTSFTVNYGLSNISTSVPLLKPYMV